MISNIGNKKLTLNIALAAIGLIISMPLVVNATPPDPIPEEGLLPELRAVVPKHLQIQNKQQQEILRFTNGIANMGPGHWQMAPVFPDQVDQPQEAKQQILDSDGNIVFEEIVSSFEFHPQHNHWHIADVAEFSVHSGSPDGPLVGNSVKVTFCIEDVYNQDGNSPTSERIYWDCEVGLQGVQVGWSDQYHQSTDGNQIDITGIAEGIHYLVHTVNPSGVFHEVDKSNNTAWIEFELIRQSNGNPKISLTGNTSPCETPALCGEVKANPG